MFVILRYVRDALLCVYEYKFLKLRFCMEMPHRAHILNILYSLYLNFLY